VKIWLVYVPQRVGTRNTQSKDGVAVDGPDPVVDLLELDVEVFQGRGDEDEFVAAADVFNPGDALDDEVARILDGW